MANVIPWEKVLLGTVIDDQKSWVEAMDIRAQDLESNQHKVIWKHILNLAPKDALSMRSLAEAMRSQGELDNLGSVDAKGEDFLRELTSKADLTALPEAIHQVQNASVKRRLEVMGVTLTQHARNGMTPEEILEEHMKDLLQVKIQGQRDPKPIWTNVDSEKKRIADIRSGDAPAPLKPNLTALSHLIPGFMPVDFALFAATPGSGKSSLMRYEAHEWAKKGKKVLVFSYENTLEEWQSWLVAKMTGLNHDKIIFPEKLTDEENERVNEAYDKLRELPIHIEEMSGDPLTTVMAVTRRHLLRETLDAVIVDGAYLIGGSSTSAYETISGNMQGLRSLAQGTHVPILATTQFNRSVSDTKDPEQSQIVYAGEQPARILVGLVKRPLNEHEIRQFPENRTRTGWLMGKNLNAVVIQCSVMKQTNGKTGRSDDIAWIKPTNDFRTLEHNWLEKAKPEKIVVEQQNIINSFPVKQPVRSYQKDAQLADPEKKRK